MEEKLKITFYFFQSTFYMLVDRENFYSIRLKKLPYFIWNLQKHGPWKIWFIRIFIIHNTENSYLAILLEVGIGEDKGEPFFCVIKTISLLLKQFSSKTSPFLDGPLKKFCISVK